jgi:hypothetical protein
VIACMWGGCTHGLWFALPPSPRRLPLGSRSPGKSDSDKFAPGLCRYRRSNTFFERSIEHLIAFVAIAFVSILSPPQAPRRRRAQRLTSTNKYLIRFRTTGTGIGCRSRKCQSDLTCGLHRIDGFTDG